MTPGAREEIEKVARDLCPAIHDETGKCRPGPGCLCRRITQDILTQVEKARREAIEECAICAEDTKFSETCSERIVALVQLRHRIAKAIRNKLERE